MASPPKSQPLVWAGVILLLAVLLWVGWKTLFDAKPEEQGAGGRGFPTATVLTKPLEERAVVEIITVTGSLRARQRAEVAARESAALATLDVDEGDLVEKGDVLATLDGRRLTAQHLEAEAALVAAQAELKQRQAEHERARKHEEMISGLLQDEAVSEREHLDSVRELKVAAAREDAAVKAIEAAEKRRDLLEVRKSDLTVPAPFAGRVVVRHTEVGEWLREGDPVVTLVSTGSLEAWLQVPERQAPVLQRKLPSAVDLRLPGVSEAISASDLALVPEVTGRSRRFLLVARVDDAEGILTPGTSVRAEVPLGEPVKRFVAPGDAILRSYAGTHIVVPVPAEGGPTLAKRVPINVLFERNGETVFTADGLKPGDPIIVEGNERLPPNAPIISPPMESVEKAGGPPGKKP